MRAVGKKLLLASTLPVAMTVASPASALTFYYEAYGGFVSGSESGMPAPANFNNLNTAYANGELNAAPDNVYQQVNWGTPVNGQQSGISLNEAGEEPPVPLWNSVTGGNSDAGIGHEWINGAVDVGSEFGSVMGWLTHHNEVIGEAFSGTVNIHYHLDIFADAAKTIGVWDSSELNFELEVWETPNAEPCPPGGGASVCDDRFRYRLLPGGSFGTFEDSSLGSFAYDDGGGEKAYGVDVKGFYNDQGELSGEFWSPENGINTTFVNFEVHQVPEPGTLVMISLGLAGLGFVARRRVQ